MLLTAATRRSFAQEMSHLSRPIRCPSRNEKKSVNKDSNSQPAIASRDALASATGEPIYKIHCTSITKIIDSREKRQFIKFDKNKNFGRVHNHFGNTGLVCTTAAQYISTIILAELKLVLKFRV